jgi:DNA-directed RNA polymerase subunit M/transcription elongation factor TFIIS
MALLTDTARFRADDPDALVSASLACPLCLHDAEVSWYLESDGYDPSVQCHCTRCDQRWRVYVEPQQELRLGLMPVAA